MRQVKLFFFAFVVLFSVNVVAVTETRSAMPFTSGSYQQLLVNHAEQAYVLVIWSITCSSCIKEMEMLREVHQERPDLKLVMLSIDDISDLDEVNELLSEKGIGDLESWVFAESNAQQLRYEIDPTWYGEIPRIYFFNAQHQRQGFSGKMSKQDFLSLIK